MKKKIVIAITGASGAIYAKLLIGKLQQLGEQISEVAIVMSDNPKEFETYIILFDTVVTDKGQFADVTHENYTIHEFNYSEL